MKTGDWARMGKNPWTAVELSVHFWPFHWWWPGIRKTGCLIRAELGPLVVKLWLPS